jgi:hypothetical protein
MTNKRNVFLVWAPRVVTIVLILFFSIWISISIYSPELSLGENLFGIVAHLFPVFLFLIVFALSWKSEIVGGVFFIGAGFLYYFTLFGFSIPWDSFLTVAGVLPGLSFLAGILFLVNWYKKRSS